MTNHMKMTDSQLVEGNEDNLNRDEPFVDFIITDSRVVNSDNDNIETVITSMDTDISIPKTNGIGVDTGPSSRKKK